MKQGKEKKKVEKMKGKIGKVRKGGERSGRKGMNIYSQN